jgi:RimJ/RimL family protein N-acetyltransferase
MNLLSPDVKKTLRLEGKRIHLTTLHPDQVSLTYVAWLNDPEINCYLESRFTPHTLESTRTFVEACWRDPHTALLAIHLNEGTRHIGNIKLGPIDPHHLRGDIGLIIGDRSCWGRGYATEAIGLVADWALGPLGLDKITAGAYAPNRASIQAFLRNGFVQEGVLKHHVCLGTGKTDVVLMAKWSGA